MQMPRGGIEKMPSTWITGQLTRLRTKPRNTIVRQDFTISPEIVKMTIKGGVGGGRWEVGEEEEKNEYLASTERTFQLKNSRLLGKSILTLERGKLKEKA